MLVEEGDSRLVVTSWGLYLTFDPGSVTCFVKRRSNFFLILELASSGLLMLPLSP